MSNIKSKYGEPAAAFLLPVGKVSDFTTSGYGIVYRPNYLPASDFSDAGEDLSSISDNTFEADGNNYFERQVIRLGADDGNNYVVISVGGTTGTDTITVDRNIEESDGDDIFISQYVSLVDITFNTQQSVSEARKLSDTRYPENLFIFLQASAASTSGQLDIFFADETEITDFELSNFTDISLHPIRKVVRNDNNVATEMYYCKPF
jgi:hypothetical protein